MPVWVFTENDYIWIHTGVGSKPSSLHGHTAVVAVHLEALHLWGPRSDFISFHSFH